MAQFYWHIHHTRLLETLTEPIENRTAYIKANKPTEEIPTRLRLMKPVRGKLPDTLTKAAVAYSKVWVTHRKARVTRDKTWVALNKAWVAYDKAWAAYAKAQAAFYRARVALNKAGVAINKTEATYQPEIEALHLLECPDCPWDGATIFPK